VKIAFGSDHAGFRLKRILVDGLRSQGYEVLDVGTDSEAPVDYPDFAKMVAEAVVAKTCDKGVIICGSGVGASIAANKVKGIRASVCHDTYSAHQGVEHDDMNTLVLGARIIGENLAMEIVNAFINARFSHEERHVRRLNKILSMEK